MRFVGCSSRFLPGESELPKALSYCAIEGQLSWTMIRDIPSPRRKLVAHLTAQLGRWRGVLASKLIAIAIAMGVRKRLWIVNVFYGVIILWNIIMIVALTTKR
jgi:hypothetical protein